MYEMNCSIMFIAQNGTDVEQGHNGAPERLFF